MVIAGRGGWRGSGNLLSKPFGLIGGHFDVEGGEVQGVESAEGGVEVMGIIGGAIGHLDDVRIGLNHAGGEEEEAGAGGDKMCLVRVETIGRRARGVVDFVLAGGGGGGGGGGDGARVSTWPMMGARSAAVMWPGRRMVGMGVVRSRTVDSMPTVQGPPSRTSDGSSGTPLRRRFGEFVQHVLGGGGGDVRRAIRTGAASGTVETTEQLKRQWMIGHCAGRRWGDRRWRCRGSSSLEWYSALGEDQGQGAGPEGLR